MQKEDSIYYTLNLSKYSIICSKSSSHLILCSKWNIFILIYSKQININKNQRYKTKILNIFIHIFTIIINNDKLYFNVYHNPFSNVIVYFSFNNSYGRLDKLKCNSSVSLDENLIIPMAKRAPKITINMYVTL
jgi:hypothetical protein